MRDLPSTLLALVFATIYQSVSASVIDFSFYPALSQGCLYQASNSSNCAADTVATANACLCYNGGNFVTNAASCLSRSDPDDVRAVYDTMKTACSDSKTPLSVSEQQYLAAAANPTTTTSASSTATTTAATTSPAATDGEQQDRKGLSAGARAGIIAGASVGGVAILAGLACFLLRRRRKRDNEESHPMLPQDYGPPTHTSLPPHAEAENSGTAWVDDAKWRPTVMPGNGRNPGFNWESPYDVSYRKPPQPLTPTPPLPPHTRLPSPHGYPQVYELVGSERQPTEMPGSTMVEMEGSPAPRQGEWRYHGAALDAVDTSYPSQAARRTSR